MDKHDWMDDVLRDIIAYAVINNMPHVARHVAIGLDALHLHVYEEERREARTNLAREFFRDDISLPLPKLSAEASGSISTAS